MRRKYGIILPFYGVNDDELPAFKDAALNNWRREVAKVGGIGLDEPTVKVVTSPLTYATDPDTGEDFALPNQAVMVTGLVDTDD